MLKKILTIILIYIVPGVVIFFGYYAYKKYEYHNFVLEKIGTCPELPVKDLKGDSLNLKLSPDTKTLLIEFNPGCEYCQTEAKSIQENIDQLNNIDICFIANAPRFNILKFQKDFKLDSIANIKFYEDAYFSMDQFPTPIIPSVYLYDEKGELLYYNFGYTSFDNILDEIQ